LVSAQKLIREGKIIAASLENHDQLLAFIASKAGKNVKILPRKNKSKRDLPVDIAVIRPLIQEVFQDDFKLFDFVNSDKNYLFS
jgi:hypothetical protein